MSELKLSSLPIKMLIAEYIILLNFTKMEGYLNMHSWSYKTMFDTIVCILQLFVLLRSGKDLT